MKNQKHSSTFIQTTKIRPAASSQNLDTKRTLPNTQKPNIHKLNIDQFTSPQKRLKNWCRIEESLLNNIYGLKHLGLSKNTHINESAYTTKRKQDAESISQKTSQLKAQILEQQMNRQSIKERLMMIREDSNSKYLRSLDIISEQQELDQILYIYRNKFPEESILLFQIIKLQENYKLLQAQLAKIDSELQDIEENTTHSKTPVQPQACVHLTRKIQNYRLQLLDFQQKLNQLCQANQKPLLRQILCHFFMKAQEQSKLENDNAAIGIELWVCKNGLVNSLDKYIYLNYKHLKVEFQKEYLEYLQVLTKIQANYVEIQRIATEASAQPESQFCQEAIKTKRQQRQKLSQKINILSETMKKLQEQLSEVLTSEQLLKLHCDIDRFDPKLVLKEIKAEQNKRMSNMKKIKFRAIYLQQMLDSKTENIQNDLVAEQVKTLQNNLNSRTKQIEKLKKDLIKKEEELSKKGKGAKRSENQELWLKNDIDEMDPEIIDEEIQALQKKLNKLQKKKQDIMNTKTEQTPLKTEESILRQLQMNSSASPLNPSFKKSKVSSKSASKLSKCRSTYNTISIRPYQPLDKAIDRLVTFKKTLACDKLKLNKAVTRLMKHI